MCLSVAPAEFTGTTLYGGRLRHPQHGTVHVLGYQNTAVNLAEGPNAMLLHLPAWHMTRRNFVSSGHSTDVLERMVEAVRPRPVVSRGGPAVMDWMGAEPAVEVFEHDIYTVLLATVPTAIPAALAEVPPHKRPSLDPRLLEFYADTFPGHAVALCCFDNARAAQAKPLFMWYRPHDPDLLTLPALDCHTGGPPDLAADVPVDHWVLFGTDEAPEDWGEPVEYGRSLRHELRALLPDRVVGTRFDGPLPNGDFAVTHSGLLSGESDGIHRLRPAAA